MMPEPESEAAGRAGTPAPAGNGPAAVPPDGYAAGLRAEVRMVGRGLAALLRIVRDDPEHSLLLRVGLLEKAVQDVGAAVRELKECWEAREAAAGEGRWKLAAILVSAGMAALGWVVAGLTAWLKH